MTTKDVIEGTKYPARKNPLRGIFWFTKIARTSARIVVKGMVPRTKNEVFFKAIQKSGSCRSLK
jgi:hypothetical protein